MKKGYAKAPHGKLPYDDSDLKRGFKQVPEPDFSEESSWEPTNNDARTGRQMPLNRGEGVK